MSSVELLLDGSIAELRLNNPRKLNALTVEMLLSLEQHCRSIENNNKVKVVILSAVGERAFCAGADISAWANLSAADFARHWVRDGHRVFDRLARLGKPTIAALNGNAFGGGLELAIACDLRIMAPGAQVALPEVSIGVVPGWSGSQRLQRMLPEPVLKEMSLFARRLSADRALALGLVAEIAQDTRQVAYEIAQQSTQLSSRAVEAAKYMIHAGAGEDSAALIEALGGGLIADSSDKAEGVRAFLQKRKPQFSGE